MSLKRHCDVKCRSERCDEC